MKQQIKANWREIAVIIILLAASVMATSFVVLRRYTTGSWHYHFLVWNLFLAWIPLGIAFLLRVMRRPPLLILLVGGAVWLAFLPNAPYILTDIVHFRWSKTGIWIDWSMFLTFALTGLFAGFASLIWMQAVVRERWGVIVGWIFTLIALISTGFGVYIGRFLRWNSWDIVTRPELVVQNILQQFFSSETYLHTWGLSLVFAILFSFSFILINLLGNDTDLRGSGVKEVQLLGRS